MFAFLLHHFNKKGCSEEAARTQCQGEEEGARIQCQGEEELNSAFTSAQRTHAQHRRSHKKRNIAKVRNYASIYAINLCNLDSVFNFNKANKRKEIRLELCVLAQAAGSTRKTVGMCGINMTQENEG